jgi:16S rRNA (guanine(527)-N(7))-methyltransferase RsmG
MCTSASVPTPDWFAQLLRPELSQSQLSQSQVAQLYHHYELLIRWNKRMNLTAVKPGPEIVVRHYCESLFFSAHLPAAHETISVLDVGSGAGFPGIPMAILKPDWRVTLIESSQRKAVFLRESSRHLSNVSVLSQRVEDVVLETDWLVARAVDPPQVLLNVPRLAPRIGLMLGEDDFSSIRGDNRIAWSEPVRLPWGDRKVCVYGECSTWNRRADVPPKRST